jgi:hypothetical protein
MSICQCPFTMWPKVAGAAGMLELITAVLVGVPTLATAQPAAEKTAASALMGSYTIVAGERDGQKIPAERVQGSSKTKRKRMPPATRWTRAASRGGSR